MKASIKDFEIMAPVGSRESLAAAIQAGADSIYFGIESLNMRARFARTMSNLFSSGLQMVEIGRASCRERV